MVPARAPGPARPPTLRRSPARPYRNTPPGGSSDNFATKQYVIRIQSHASGRCIDVVDHRRRNGTPIQVWDCSWDDWLQWHYYSDGTFRTMGKCMTLVNSSTGDGTAIRLSDCNGSWTQQFRLVAAHDLVNPHADKCVDVKDRGTANGSRLQLWTCNGQGNQKWSSA
ncbi:ricin-type beta-trefoil lectin domain protein [Streptomyces sp. NPDC002159]